MQCAFIIPNYNGREILRQCLKTLRQFHSDEKVFIVDDCSSLENQEYAAKLAKEYNCSFSVNAENSGFAKTVNAGLKHPDNNADISILVNSDIEFVGTVTHKFIDSFETQPHTGIVGGLLLYPPRYPRDEMIQHAGVFRFKHKSGYAWTHKNWFKQLDQCFDAKISEFSMSVTGALYGIRMEMIKKIGYFDERFFLAFEDTEYSLRAWQNDWHVYYNADIMAIHHEGYTRGRNPQDKIKKNPEGFEKEKQGQKIFEQECDKIDFVEIINNIDCLNNVSKITRLNVLNEKEGSLCLVRKGALGDVLFLTPIIKELNEKWPKIKVKILTDYPDIFDNNPYIDCADKANIKADIVINLDMSYEITPNVSVIDSYARKVFGYTVEHKPQLFSKFLNVQGINPYIVINMSKSWQSRTWPVEYWNEIIKHVLDMGYKIYCLGTKKDIDPPQIEGIVDFRDRTTINKCYNIIKQSKLFIGMDSGLLHVANCADIPTIGIFTCVNPDLRIPRNTEKCTTVIPDVECKFCLHQKKPPVTFFECNELNKYVCTRNIKPEIINKIISEKLEDLK